jgi:uncharacterized protein YoxC
MTRDIQSTEEAVESLPDAVHEIGSVIRAQVEVQGICRTCSKEIARATRQLEEEGEKP